MYALTSTPMHYLHHSSPSLSVWLFLHLPATIPLTHSQYVGTWAVRLSVLPHPLSMSVSFSIPPTSSLSHHFLCGLHSTPTLLHYYFLCMSLSILIPLSLLPLSYRYFHGFPLFSLLSLCTFLSPLFPIISICPFPSCPVPVWLSLVPFNISFSVCLSLYPPHSPLSHPSVYSSSSLPIPPLPCVLISHCAPFPASLPRSGILSVKLKCLRKLNISSLHQNVHQNTHERINNHNCLGAFPDLRI